MNDELNACPVCRDSAAMAPTGVRVGVKSTPAWRCGACGAYFVNPPQKVEYNNSGWTQIRKDKWKRDIEIAKRHAPRILAAAQSLLKRPVRRVLEVGCGSGYMGIGFEAAGCKYTGLEVDASSIEWAREQGLDIYCVPAEQLDIWSKGYDPYDLLISSNTYEHVVDPDAAFRALAHTKVALIALIVPNAEGLVSSLKASKTVRQLASIVSRNRQTVWSLDGSWHNIAYSGRTLRLMADRHGIALTRVVSIAINDPVWGFVQPNPSLVYRAVERIEAFAKRRTELLMLSKPR